MFLIVGELDNRSTPEMSKQVYDALKYEKDFWIVQNATHGYPRGPEFSEMDLFFKKTITFFKKHLLKN